jgi:predicted nucleic acid-binding protein
MQRIIISDTSCLILLERIGQLLLLQKLFGTIVTTPEVLAEFGAPLPTWFEIKEASDTNYQAIIAATLDKGEASAIALAIEQDDALLIIDESKGRKLAQQLGLKITGTAGIVVEAKLAGLIPSVKPMLYAMR